VVVVLLKCHRCGYVWFYGGQCSRATCPSCRGKVKVGGGFEPEPCEWLRGRETMTLDEFERHVKECAVCRDALVYLFF
jgi:hypothetical protein